METDDAATTLVGTTVGNYEVVKRLGAGAMGEVYLGEHPKIGRRVAIKVVMGALSANAEVTDRFLSEARAVSKMNHPNLIQIFDYGNLPDGRLYYVMEYLDGQDLSDLLNDSAPLPPSEAAELLRQITAAMEAAHAVGIVHRDLKPDNIFVADTNAGPLVKILDFGIAKLLEPAFGSESRTATGMIMGTPMYMSPEQAAGQVNDISPRTDIYALGVIAYEMLCGRCPFVGQTTALVLTAHITEPPPPLQTFVQGLPPALEAFIQRALAKAPADRHQTMKEFYTGFQHAASSGLEALLPTMAPDKAPRGSGTAGVTGGLGDAPTMASTQPGHAGPAAPSPRAIGSAATVADTGPGLTPDTTLGRSATESVPNGALIAEGQRPVGNHWIIGLVVVLTLAMAVGTYFMLRDKRPAPKPDPPPSTAMAGTPDAATAAPTPRPRAAIRRPPPGPAAIRRIQVVSRTGRLKVRVTVPGAPTYTRKTPFTVDARQGERVILKVSRSGHHSETRTVVVEGDMEISFALTRLGRSRPRSRPMVKEPPVRRPAMPPVMQPAMRPVMRPMSYGESTISPFGMK